VEKNKLGQMEIYQVEQDQNIKVKLLLDSYCYRDAKNENNVSKELKAETLCLFN
jgi:hypothetical protein